MKIKRFQASSMREAIRMVREEQGPDAVILANHRTADGVEVVAAVDYDAALIQQASRGSRTPPLPPDEPPPARSQRIPAEPKPALSGFEALLQGARQSVERQQMTPPAAVPMAPAAAGIPTPARAQPTHQAATMQLQPPMPPAAAVPMHGQPMAAPSEDLLRLQSEMAVMRGMMEEQLASRRWGDMQRYRPVQAAAMRMLADLGIESELCRQIAEQVPEQSEGDRARFLPLGLLGRRLPADASDPILSGGVIALVGPTGVGKTTTIAKLAARYAAVHGTRDIALVTTDDYRVGAQEQLYTYGRLLGVSVHAVTAQDSLDKVLDRLADRRLVLIDTAGISQRDRQLTRQMARLKSVGSRLKTYLVLATNAQPGSQHEAMTRFGELKLAGCILTKLDEAERAGASLSLTIRHRMPVAYYTDGQRVPEDIHPGRADRLVLRAMQLSRSASTQVDDEVLVSGFRQVAHAHA